MHHRGPAFRRPPFLFEIADVGKSKELDAFLETKGIKATFPSANIRIVDEQTNCAVWIGKNVPLAALQTVLPEAIRLYPYLKFFYIVGERGEVPPEAFHRTIHIGGSIEAAQYKKLNVIDRQEFLKTLAAAKTIEELHKYLLEKNKARGASRVFHRKIRKADFSRFDVAVNALLTKVFYFSFTCLKTTTFGCYSLRFLLPVFKDSFSTTHHLELHNHPSLLYSP